MKSFARDGESAGRRGTSGGGSAGGSEPAGPAVHCVCVMAVTVGQGYDSSRPTGTSRPDRVWREPGRATVTAMNRLRRTSAAAVRARAAAALVVAGVAFTGCGSSAGPAPSAHHDADSGPERVSRSRRPRRCPRSRAVSPVPSASRVPVTPVTAPAVRDRQRRGPGRRRDGVPHLPACRRGRRLRHRLHAQRPRDQPAPARRAGPPRHPRPDLRGRDRDPLRRLRASRRGPRRSPTPCGSSASTSTATPRPSPGRWRSRAGVPWSRTRCAGSTASGACCPHPTPPADRSPAGLRSCTPSGPPCTRCTVGTSRSRYARAARLCTRGPARERPVWPG